MGPTLSHVLLQTLETSGERTAIRAAGLDLTYRAVGGAVERLAGTLGELGLAGRRVGVLLPNGPAFPIALHAIFHTGGSALLLNPASAPRELAEQLADAETETVLTTSALHDRLPGPVRKMPLDDLPEAIHPGRPRGSSGSLSAGPLRDPALASAEDEAVVIFTSGMRGRMRGAVLSHANLVANLEAVVAAMNLTPGDRVLGAIPFAHAFGLTVCLGAPLATGATILPQPRFHPAALLDLLETEEPTVLTGVPAIFTGLLAAAAKRGVPAHSLRLAVCGGAPLALRVIREWEEVFGLALRQGYGLTEASPVCLFNALDQPNRPGTLGTPLPGVAVSVRDLGGVELPPGEVGELCVRGANVFRGYLDGGSAAEYFHGEWLRTGDLATAANGVVRFRGTLKPMFTRNGFNVFPEEVRRVLRTDPRIEDVRVCARPDPLRGDEIVLVVRTRPGEPLGEDDVRSLCHDLFASYKQPARVVIERPGGSS
jgi:long-chain acyl-CoA synthetase